MHVVYNHCELTNTLILNCSWCIVECYKHLQTFKKHWEHSDWPMHFVMLLENPARLCNSTMQRRTKGGARALQPPFFSCIYNEPEKIWPTIFIVNFSSSLVRREVACTLLQFLPPRLFEFYGSTLQRTWEHLQAQKKLQKIALTSSPNCSAM